ncbi:hypothetical protein [Streptomyces sp. NPDC059008]|uniref:hypothetical protein n=1 Tax=Streptomyces sp. NPDC059008 TaxID=3346693 RepID=UPI0036CD7733
MTAVLVNGWWREVTPVRLALPSGYVPVRPVVVGPAPDRNELVLRAWLRIRIGGVG